MPPYLTYIILSTPYQIHSFASPRVGASSFLHAYQYMERVGRIRHARFSNNRDLVPMVQESPRLYFFFMCIREVNISLQWFGYSFSHHLPLFDCPYKPYVLTKVLSYLFINRETRIFQDFGSPMLWVIVSSRRRLSLNLRVQEVIYKVHVMHVDSSA